MDTNCGAAGNVLIANGGSFDHIVIPGGQCNTPPALPAAIALLNILNDRYCGTALYCLGAIPTAAISAAATDATVCSNQKPFKISVESDGLEYMDNAANAEGVVGNNVGFSISNSWDSHWQFVSYLF